MRKKHRNGEEKRNSVGDLRQRGNLFRYYFVRPGEGTDSNEVVKRIMNLKPVEEVLLTEGDCGYIVKVRAKDEGVADGVGTYLKKKVDKKVGSATSFVQYTR